MVQKGTACDKHPRDKLGTVQDQHRCALTAAAPADLMPEQPHQRRQTHDPDDRPGHARNAGLHTIGQTAVAIVPYGAQPQQPSVPAALKRVRCLERGVVAVHRKLAPPPIAEAEIRLPPPVRQVGRHIDAEGQHHIEQHPAQRCQTELCPKARAALLPARPKHAQIKHRQPGPRIDAGPLGCTAQPESNAAQRHRQQRMLHAVGQHPLAVPHHAVRAQQDKEGAINVNRSKAALGKAHKVERQQHPRRCRRPGPAGQAAHKAPRQRHQQHTEQRAGEPPPEPGHAEQRNPQHDKILAERRMGRLIDRHPVQLLIAGAAVVDLIKIHAV